MSAPSTRMFAAAYPPPSRRRAAACPILLLLALLAGRLAGQTSLYWDINSTTAGTGGATPTGTWRDTTNLNWNSVADGTGTTTAWTGNSIAVFSAGSDATGSYTVTISGTQNVDSIIIEEGNITFASNTLNFTGTTPSVDVASGLTAIFSTGITGTNFIKTGDGDLVFQGTAKGYTGSTTVSAGTLRLGATNMIGNTSAVTVASGATLNLNNFTETVGSIAGAGAINLGSATLTTGGDNTSTEFSGVVSGTGALTKSGTGTLVLSGANTYSGATSVGAGALNIRHSDALGTTAAGTTVTSGEELQLQGGIAVGAEALSITGTGLSSTGALRNIADTNSFAGLITLAGNTQFTADAGNLTLSGGITGTNRNLTVTGAGDISITGALTTGTGTLLKTGAGTLTLSGANTYTGATTVGASNASTGGTLRLGAANALSNATTTVFAGTLDLNGHSDTIGALTLGGGAAGTSATVTTGAGTLTLGGNVTYSATNNADGATIAGHLGLGGANRTFTIGNSTAVTDDLTVSAVVSGANALIKAGTGTLVLSGANTYTGATSVTAGVLNIRHSSALGTTDAGTTVTSGEELQLQGNIAVGAEALSLTGTGVSTTGALRNISGNNSYAGTVTLAGNTRITADADSLTLTGGIIAAGNTLTLAGAGDISLSGNSTGSGSLTKLDAGTLTLGGTNSSTGTTIIGVAGGTATGNVILGSDHGLAGGTLTNYASTLDLNGHNDTIGALTLGGGATGTSATVTTGAGTLTLGGNVTYSATNNADGATIAGHLGLGGANRTFTIGNSTAVTDDLTVSAVVSGASALIKAGAGTLVLSGANTHTGATSVTAGVLNIRHSSALGTTDAGTTVSNGAALQLEGGIAIGAEALSLTGTGVSTTGALLNLSGSNSYAGAVTLAGNTQITAEAGNLSLSGGISGANRTLTLTGAGNFSINGLATGTGALSQNGTGTTTLTAASTYTGATAINAGTLVLGASDILSDSTAVTVASGATLNVNNHTETIATLAGAGAVTLGSGTLVTAGTGSTTYSGVMTGTGAFTKDGSGTLTLSGANTYTGATTINTGILRVGTSDVIANTSAVTVASGATFDVNDFTETVATLAGAGTVDLGSGSLTTAGAADTTFSGAIIGTGGSLTKQGAGTLILAGASTFTGATSVDAGALRLGASDRLSNSTAVTIAAGATLDVNGFTETIATLAGAGTLDLGGGTLITAGAGNTTFSGALTGGGTFTKGGGGTLTLDQDLTFDGTFNLAGGTLRLSDITLSITTLNITGTSFIDFAGVSTLNITNFNISGGVTLTIQNWADASDHFFTQFWTGATMETRGQAPMNQITFTGFAANNTKWQAYDDQITPVPEPATYGAVLLVFTAGLLGWRRRRLSRRAA